MTDNSREFIKKDLSYIIQLNSQVNYGNKNSVRQAYNMILKQKLFKTALGQKYIKRLEQILNKEKSLQGNTLPKDSSHANPLNKCVLCGKDLDNKSAVCNSCLEKYKLMPSVSAAKATHTKTDIAIPNQKPWMFSRALIALAAAFALTYICATQLGNLNAIAGLMLIGSITMPISVLIFIFEVNSPKNIGIYEIMKMFFFGGMTSLLLTLFLFEIFPVGQLSYTESIIVALIESVGRLLPIIIFVILIKPKCILNGLLIGASIGAGFATFETAGYAFRFYLLSNNNINYLIDILLLRAWSSLGTHTAWTAITAAGFVMAMIANDSQCSTGDKPSICKCFIDKNFIVFFFIPIILHAIWDCPFMDTGSNVYIKLIVLIAAAWTILFTLVKAGLQK